MSQEPGWYTADGDLAGTFRYWDGGRWIGEAKTTDAIDLTQTPTVSGPITNSVTFGGLWDRLLARFFDSFLLGLADVILFLVFDVVLGAPSAATALLMGAALLVYEVAFVAIAGATPGKKMVGLKVINRNNAAPPGWGPAVLRTLPWLLGAIPFLGGPFSLLLHLASVILIWVTVDRRSVFDFVGRTHVVKIMAVAHVSETRLGGAEPLA